MTPSKFKTGRSLWLRNAIHRRLPPLNIGVQVPLCIELSSRLIIQFYAARYYYEMEITEQLQSY